MEEVVWSILASNRNIQLGFNASPIADTRKAACSTDQSRLWPPPLHTLHISTLVSRSDPQRERTVVTTAGHSRIRTYDFHRVKLPGSSFSTTYTLAGTA